MNDIFQITIILVASLIATIISRRINIPAVIGQMLVGILLAPAVLGWIHGGHTIDVMSEIGVILLMFLAGLEADLSLLRKYLKPSLIVAITGVFAPLIVFGLTAKFMGYNISTSSFYGIVFAATSVSITVEVLQEYGKLSSRAGNIILGAAVVDDILAVLVLSIFTSTKNASSNLTTQILLQILFVIFLIFVYKIIPKLWKFVDKLPIPNKHTTVALLICLILSLTANAAGMSAVIGAFFAGLAIGQTNVAHKIEEYSSAIAYTIFIPIFFVSIALSVKFDSLLSNPLMIFSFTILAILTKFLPAYFTGKTFGLPNEENLLIGSGMVSRGEMALIIAQIGLTSHVIAENVYSELVIVIMLSTLIAPFLIKFSLRKSA